VILDIQGVWRVLIVSGVNQLESQQNPQRILELSLPLVAKISILKERSIIFLAGT